MIVRPATAADAEAIARVHVLTWQSSYRGLVPDDCLDALVVGRRTEMWRKVLGEGDASERVWVGLDAGEIVGFVAVGPCRDDDADEQTGELYAIYVLSEHQRRGVGRALMDVATSWLAERYTCATLWVITDNDRSRSFYTSSGWHFDGATKRDDRGAFFLEEARHRNAFGSPRSEQPPG